MTRARETMPLPRRRTRREVDASLRIVRTWYVPDTADARLAAAIEIYARA